MSIKKFKEFEQVNEELDFNSLEDYISSERAKAQSLMAKLDEYQNFLKTVDREHPTYEISMIKKEVSIDQHEYYISTYKGFNNGIEIATITNSNKQLVTSQLKKIAQKFNLREFQVELIGRDVEAVDRNKSNKDVYEINFIL